MVPFILGPQEHHGAATAAQYRAKHAAFLARKRAAGQRFAVHEVTTPIHARVHAGQWVVDCACGAGNSASPAWGLACCFSCGAVHSVVIFPPDVPSIEAALIARPVVAMRHWMPGETVAALLAETAAVAGDRS